MLIDQMPGFPEMFKKVVDRICEGEEKTRAELASELDLNPSSLSTAAYRGEIGFPLVELLGNRADLSDREMADIEIYNEEQVKTSPILPYHGLRSYRCARRL